MRTFRNLFTLLIAGCLAACPAPDIASIGTFQTVETPAADDAIGPRFSQLGNGSLVLAWIEKGERGGTLRAAAFEGGKFADAFDIVQDERMFVNWADLPSVTHVSDGHWFAHWLRYSAEKTYSYDVVISQSIDSGKSWSVPKIVHDDGTPTEHGFVSMFPDESGLGLIWLDGRNTPDGPMTLRSAIVTPDGSLQEEQQVDPNVCDCCQTDVAMSSRGPLAVYRDRTENEIRDIYITRHDGERWLPGSRLYEDNWHIPGCPVNGPSIVADGDLVAVALFAAADNKPIVRVATSSDGGETFGTPVEIASGRIAGYVGIDILDPAHIGVSWVARNESGSNAVMVRAVAIDGSSGRPVHVADTQQLRVFPQLAANGARVVLVWTDDSDGEHQMKAAIAPWNPGN